jgi:hypothetical protein
MPAYRVLWEIDVITDNPVEAAREALKIQLDAGRSWSGVFDVFDDEGNKMRVDLDEDPATAELIG